MPNKVYKTISEKSILKNRKSRDKGDKGHIVKFLCLQNVVPRLTPSASYQKRLKNLMHVWWHRRMVAGVLGIDSLGRGSMLTFVPS